VRAIIGFGERKAKQEGYRDNTEDERFRSVVVFLSHSPVPPPPIDMDLGDNIDDTIRVITQITDIVGGVTMLSIFLEGLLATVLDLLGLFAAFIGAILALPGIWLKVDQIVHFNGRAQGMWNAFQDMADQFRDPSLTYARSRHGPPPAGHSRAIARCRRSSS